MITVEQIQKTQTFKNANAVQQLLIVKKANRELLDNAIKVYQNTGHVSEILSGVNSLLVGELIVDENLKNLK
jgi:hypothetical protein